MPWWIEQDTDARIRGVDRAKKYLDEHAHFGLLSIPFEVVEQAIWLATTAAEKGPDNGRGSDDA